MTTRDSRKSTLCVVGGAEGQGGRVRGRCRSSEVDEGSYSFK